MSEFWRDNKMDSIIELTIEIFSKIEGVELVRLNGLTKYLNKIKPISKEEVSVIIKKLNQNNIIDYKCELNCPHCGEVSYLIVENDSVVKLCDTCNLMYDKQLNKTYFINIKNRD